MITNQNISPLSAPPLLLKLREVAKVLSLSRMSVKALIECGDLQARDLHPSKRKMQRKHVRITRKSLAKFYKARFNQELDSALQPQPTP